MLGMMCRRMLRSYELTVEGFTPGPLGRHPPMQQVVAHGDLVGCPVVASA